MRIWSLCSDVLIRQLYRSYEDVFHSSLHSCGRVRCRIASLFTWFRRMWLARNLGFYYSSLVNMDENEHLKREKTCDLVCNYINPFIIKDADDVHSHLSVTCENIHFWTRNFPHVWGLWVMKLREFVTGMVIVARKITRRGSIWPVPLPSYDINSPPFPQCYSSTSYHSTASTELCDEPQRHFSPVWSPHLRVESRVPHEPSVPL